MYYYYVLPSPRLLARDLLDRPAWEKTFFPHCFRLDSNVSYWYTFYAFIYIYKYIHTIYITVSIVLIYITVLFIIVNVSKHSERYIIVVGARLCFHATWRVYTYTRGRRPDNRLFFFSSKVFAMQNKSYLLTCSHCVYPSMTARNMITWSREKIDGYFYADRVRPSSWRVKHEKVKRLTTQIHVT